MAWRVPAQRTRFAVDPAGRAQKLRNAVSVSFADVLLFLLLSLCWLDAREGRFIGVVCFMLGVPLSLCVCLVRTGLILENDKIAVLLCFLATALNREGSGRTREEIVAQSRLREWVA